MAARANVPYKYSLDELQASEVNALNEAISEHASELESYASAFQQLYAAGILAGKVLCPLALPQAVTAGYWYLTASGVWEAKSSFQAGADPASGAYWRCVASFNGAATVGSAGITDATDAGRAMLTALSAAAQRLLVNNPRIRAGAYGDHPAFSTEDGDAGSWAYVFRALASLNQSLGALQPAPATAAPIVTGFLPSKGSEGASVTLTGSRFVDITSVSFNGTSASFQVINSTTIQVVVPSGATTGPVSVATASATGTSAASFTVGAVAVVVTTPVVTTPDLTAALAISLAQITLGASMGYSISPAGGTVPYAYQVVATNVSTGATFALGSTKSGTWQAPTADQFAIDATVTDSSSPAKVVETATRYLNVVAAANRIPVADAGGDVTIQLPTSSVVLMGTASDPDSGDTLTYAWRQITGPNNAVGLPATSLNVVASGLVAGTYQFGFRSTDNHGAQSSEDFVVVTVQAAAQSGQRVVLTPQASTYGLNVLNRADSAGNVQRSYGSYLDGTSDNGAARFNLTNTEAAGNAQPSSITILQAGQPAQTVRPTGGQGATDYDITLLGSAPYKFRIVLGTLERANEQGDILGRVFNSLSFPAGTNASLAAPTKQSEAVIFITDSIGTGTGSTTPELEGWLPKLRALDTGRDYLNDGYQSRQGSVAIGSSAAIGSLGDEIATARTGYNKVTQALCLFTNDYNKDPATLGGYVTNWLTLTRQRFPSDRLIVASPIVANSAYASESNMPAIRTAAQQAVSNFGDANALYVNGLNLLGDNAQLNPDGVHPLPNGHTIMAGNWLQALQAQQGGVSAQVNSSNIQYLPNTAAFNFFHNTTTPTANYLMAALTYINNSPAQGTIVGSSINVFFNGTQAKLDHHLERQGTDVQVLIDDNVVGTFSQYNAAEQNVPNYHYLTPAVAAGNHKLTLKKLNDTGDTKIYWFEGITIYGGTGIIAPPAGTVVTTSNQLWATTTGVKRTVSDNGRTASRAAGVGSYDNYAVGTQQFTGPGGIYDLGVLPISQNLDGVAIVMGTTTPGRLGRSASDRYHDLSYGAYMDLYNCSPFQLNSQGDAASGGSYTGAYVANARFKLRFTSNTRVDILDANDQVVGGFDEPTGIAWPQVPYVSFNTSDAATAALLATQGTLTSTNLANSNL
ncbi:MAG: PKD domain-containing protein [Janthinobacterium lividum]